MQIYIILVHEAICPCYLSLLFVNKVGMMEQLVLEIDENCQDTNFHTKILTRSFQDNKDSTTLQT